METEARKEAFDNSSREGGVMCVCRCRLSTTGGTPSDWEQSHSIRDRGFKPLYLEVLWVQQWVQTVNQQASSGSTKGPDYRAVR